jgi:hypothetical protein
MNCRAARDKYKFADLWSNCCIAHFTSSQREEVDVKKGSDAGNGWIERERERRRGL